jgi:hypothetical protein
VVPASLVLALVMVPVAAVLRAASTAGGAVATTAGLARSGPAAAAPVSLPVSMVALALVVVVVDVAPPFAALSALVEVADGSPTVAVCVPTGAGAADRGAPAVSTPPGSWVSSDVS